MCIFVGVKNRVTKIPDKILIELSKQIQIKNAN